MSRYPYYQYAAVEPERPLPTMHIVKLNFSKLVTTDKDDDAKDEL